MSAIIAHPPISIKPQQDQTPDQKPAQSASQDLFTFNMPTIADSSMKRSQ